MGWIVVGGIIAGYDLANGAPEDPHMFILHMAFILFAFIKSND